MDQPSQSAPPQLVSQDPAVQLALKIAEEREATCREREENLRECEAEVRDRKVEVSDREVKATKREDAVKDREDAVSDREDAVKKLEVEMKDLQVSSEIYYAERLAKLEAREKMVTQREHAVTDAEAKKAERKAQEVEEEENVDMGDTARDEAESSEGGTGEDDGENNLARSLVQEFGKNLDYGAESFAKQSRKLNKGSSQTAARGRKKEDNSWIVEKVFGDDIPASTQKRA